MVTNETKEYLENQDKRLAGIDPTTLNGLFDQFGALFSAFNRLYNEAYKVLKTNGKITKSRVPDWERAIAIPVHFIGANEIVDFIIKSGGEKYC